MDRRVRQQGGPRHLSTVTSADTEGTLTSKHTERSLYPMGAGTLSRAFLRREPSPAASSGPAASRSQAQAHRTRATADAPSVAHPIARPWGQFFGASFVPLRSEPAVPRHEPVLVDRTANERRNTGSGRAIETCVRSPMERAFRESFANVRVHTDLAAVGGVGLAAVTHGEQIAFAEGRYEPKLLAGRMLLAHELAHVVQQRRGNAHGATSTAEAEREADAAASRAVTGRFVTVLARRPVAAAGNGEDATSWLERARQVVRNEVRARTGETLGIVEGVATEAATAVDSVLWPTARGLQALDSVVKRASNAAHLSPAQRAIAHGAVNAAVDTLVPAARAVRQVQALADLTGSVDPVTGVPSFAAAAGHAGDAVDRVRVAVVGQGQPEYGIFTAREMGQLEGVGPPDRVVVCWRGSATRTARRRRTRRGRGHRSGDRRTSGHLAARTRVLGRRRPSRALPCRAARVGCSARASVSCWSTSAWRRCPRPTLFSHWHATTATTAALTAIVT